MASWILLINIPGYYKLNNSISKKLQSLIMSSTKRHIQYSITYTFMNPFHYYYTQEYGTFMPIYLRIYSICMRLFLYIHNNITTIIHKNMVHSCLFIYVYTVYVCVYFFIYITIYMTCLFHCMNNLIHHFQHATPVKAYRELNPVRDLDEDTRVFSFYVRISTGPDMYTRIVTITQSVLSVWQRNVLKP